MEEEENEGEENAAEKSVGDDFSKDVAGEDAHSVAEACDEFIACGVGCSAGAPISRLSGYHKTSREILLRQRGSARME